MIKLKISKNKIFKFIIIIISTILLWIFLDLYTLISLTTKNPGDITAYHNYYNIITNLSLFEVIEKFDPKGYFLLNYFFQNLGFSFANFLFFTLIVYYIVTYKIFYNLTLSKKNIYIIFIILFSSFWAQSLLFVALRQGITHLIIAYLLFGKENISFLRKFFALIISINFHTSGIILLPYLLLERFALKNINFINFVFIFCTIIYCFNIPLFYSYYLNELFVFFQIDTHSLMFFDQYETSYKLGFSINKLMVSLIPLILFILSGHEKNDSYILKMRIYFYYLYIIVIGMLLSGFIFHDRIFLYAWALTPVLLVYAISHQRKIILFISDLFKSFKIK